MDDQNTNKENITFFLEDTIIDELEDNKVELEEMLQKFQFDCNDENINIDINMQHTGDDLKDLSYFIKKDFYYGNDELYYNEEYKIKDLIKICQYYGIAKNIKASKCKKQDIVSTIVFFESSIENYELVEKRHRMWAYMSELLEDPKMKPYLIW